MNFLYINNVTALLFTAITTFFIGTFVLVFSRKDKIKIVYGLYSYSIAWWSFFQVLTNTTDNIYIAKIFSIIVNIGIPFIPTLFLHFTSLLLNKQKFFLIKLSYLFSITFSILSFSHSFVPGVNQRIFFVKNFTIPGPLFIYSLLFFIVIVTYGLVLLFRAARTATGVKRQQINYFLWPSLLGYIGGGANYFIIYGIYIPILMPFGTYFVGLYTFFVAYSVLKFQLMDIKIAIKRTFIYSLGISLISGAMIAVSFLSNLFANIIPGFNYWLVPLFIGSVSFILGRIFWNKSKEVDKLKYEFITIAAHKLRTPITEIKWAVEAAKDIQDDKEKNNLFSDIEKANTRLLTLTDDLLMISKLESAKNEYKLEKNDLEKIAREVMDDYQRQMKEKNIKLVYGAEKDLPLVNIDKIRISSVIQILLENAIAYTKNEIKINIDAYKDKVLFHIEDNGIGVNKEDQPYIFSNFFRSHDAYLSETEGAGINLFLAKNIIEKHNGKIGVRSKGKDRGSVFWFELPVEI